MMQLWGQNIRDLQEAQQTGPALGQTMDEEKARLPAFDSFAGQTICETCDTAFDALDDDPLSGDGSAAYLPEVLSR